MSGSGNNTSSDDKEPKKKKTTGGKYPVLAYDGYPADCVNWALNTAKLKVDVVVSGINEGLNAGKSACTSGTIGAARTAALAGIPAVAISQEFVAGEGNFTAALNAVRLLLIVAICPFHLYPNRPSLSNREFMFTFAIFADPPLSG
jgi:5'/3'-nucleotidase SurE